MAANDGNWGRGARILRLTPVYAYFGRVPGAKPSAWIRLAEPGFG